MKYIIFFAIAILSFYLREKYFDKIDKEQENYNKKDGYAKYIRSSFPNLIDDIIRLTKWSIFKERDDAILIGCKDIEYICLGQNMSELRIVYIKQSTVIKEWNFKKQTSNSFIIEELTKYIS